MNVEINGSPILTTLPIFGGIPLTATLVVTWSIMLLLTLFCIWLTHDLRVDHVTTRQTIAEFLVNTAQSFVDSNMGTRFSHYRYLLAFAAFQPFRAAGGLFSHGRSFHRAGLGGAGVCAHHRY